MVGIPDMLHLVYAPVHTPDIIPQHLQTQLGSVRVFLAQKISFLKTVANFS